LAGRIYLIRYGDDFVNGCTERGDAQKVWEILPGRLGQFGLELSPEKSRLIGFRRKAYLERQGKGQRVEIVWHRRETRRQTEKTNLKLSIGENRSAPLKSNKYQTTLKGDQIRWFFGYSHNLRQRRRLENPGTAQSWL
jgi:hypothetical protein